MLRVEVQTVNLPVQVSRNVQPTLNERTVDDEFSRHIR